MSETGVCTEREFGGSDLDAQLSEGFETMHEIIEEGWKRYRNEPQFKFAVDRTYEGFIPTDLAVYIVGSAYATARMIVAAQEAAYLDGVVAGASKAALLLNADALIEEIQDDNCEDRKACECGGQC